MARRPLSALMVAAAGLLLTTGAVETVYFSKEAERWYPEYLGAMKEPSLYERRSDRTIEQYRFLWLRTFHKPVSVRILKDEARITLRVVRLSGKGGYDPGRIERDESFDITADQWEGFLKLVEKASFWRMRSAEEDLGGLDGSRWVLEGLSRSRYHVVDRWSPSDDSEKRGLGGFVACCRYLLKLSKEDTPRKDDY